MSGSTLSVAMAVLRRVMIQTFKNPAIIIPSLAFPLVFLVAFAGGLSTVSNVPGLSFKGGYTAFQFVFVFLQTGAFAGIFTGYRIAEDYESGFARRLLIAAPHARGIVRLCPVRVGALRADRSDSLGDRAAGRDERDR